MSGSVSVAAPGHARPTLALPVAGIAFVALVAILPAAMRSTLVPRMAVVLVVGAVGLPLLGVLIARRDRAAVVAAAFAAWACLSAALARSPLAWSGEYWSGTGAVFAVVLASTWAAGRALPHDVVPWLRGGIVAGALANAAVAVAQGPLDLARFSLPLFDERSTGFLGNSVFLGAVCAAAVPLSRPLVQRAPALGAVAVAVLAAAVQMSGTRVALAVAVVSAFVSAVRLPRLAGAALVVGLVVGVWVGSALQADSATTAARRLGEPTGGLAQRSENWRTAADAVADRPLVGYGPGRYVEGTSPRRTLALARAGPDRLYFDAHNIGVEYAVTTGIVGAGLLVAWLVVAVAGLRRDADVDLLVAAVGLLVFHLVEPLHVIATPLLFVLLGAAAARVGLGIGPRVRAAQAGLVLVALALGVRLLVGDIALYQANLDFREAPAERARPLLRPWVEPLIIESRIHVLRGQEREDRAELLKAEPKARLAFEGNPGDPLRALEHAGVLVRLGFREQAAEAYAAALRANPWSQLALTGRAEQLEASGRAEAGRGCRELLAILAGTRNGSGVSRSRSTCLGP